MVSQRQCRMAEPLPGNRDGKRYNHTHGCDRRPVRRQLQCGRYSQWRRRNYEQDCTGHVQRFVSSASATSADHQHESIKSYVQRDRRWEQSCLEKYPG